MRKILNEKSKKNDIRKTCKEIVQYYCCYLECGLIPELFHNLTQKKKKRLTNGNFEEDSHVSCVSMKDEREEIENKLLNEEIIQYYCCYHWCGLIPRHFHYLNNYKK